MTETQPRVTLDAFLAWLAARGVDSKSMAVFEAGAERLLALAHGGPVLPAHIESAALAAQTAGASAQGVGNLRKIGAALMAFQRERAAGAQPRFVYCNQCKMSYVRDRYPAGCPYCRTPGFARLMQQRLDEERRVRARRAAMMGIATQVVAELASGLAEAGASAALDGAFPDLGDVPDEVE